MCYDCNLRDLHFYTPTTLKTLKQRFFFPVVVKADPDFVNKVVTLQMNEKFMAHVQKFKYKRKGLI